VDLLPDRLQVVGGLLERVGPSVKVVEVVGAVGLPARQVVEGQAQFPREVADLGVVLVDQLPAVLGDLAVGERLPDRPAAAPDPELVPFLEPYRSRRVTPGLRVVRSQELMHRDERG